ncbi:hypothetical protein [Butyrivibrio sp. AE3004]|uniref:hypothetical protein n=1 Tax=Butyrivibrio sp. AE3004 TaxID=1506994 RepID=UPI000AF84D81|nr:hypothetical protein [Butyrivibrio sp. AE3004]
MTIAVIGYGNGSLRVFAESITDATSVGAGAVLDDIVDGKNENKEEANAPSEFGSLPKALSCTFIVPAGFHISDIPGQYVNEHYPLESANVTYNMTVLPKEKVLTNAEKAAGKTADNGVEYRYNELTSKMYESIQKENYQNLYGENINFTMETFEKKEFDGFPGYLIKTSFTPENAQTIHQMTAIVLSSNKVFTVVFSRAADDDFEEAFIESLESIHVIKLD